MDTGKCTDIMNGGMYGIKNASRVKVENMFATRDSAAYPFKPLSAYE